MQGFERGVTLILGKKCLKETFPGNDVITKWQTGRMVTGIAGTEQQNLMQKLILLTLNRSLDYYKQLGRNFIHCMQIPERGFVRTQQPPAYGPANNIRQCHLCSLTHNTYLDLVFASFPGPKHSSSGCPCNQ